MESFFVTAEEKSESHKEKIGKRLREVEFQYRLASGNQKQLLEDRLTRLSGNMALIKIGGLSETEQQEIKDKLTDGLNAVRNIMEYGALPGGGAALVHASRMLESFPKVEEEEINNGLQILKEAIRAPMIHIINNGKLSGDYYVISLLEKHTDPWIGYCLNREKFGNMKDFGVLDSFHNIKNIMQDAVSIGSMLLTTECVIYRNKRYTRKPFA